MPTSSPVSMAGVFFVAGSMPVLDFCGKSQHYLPVRWSDGNPRRGDLAFGLSITLGLDSVKPANRRRRRAFTLMEVVVAALILSMTASMVFAIVAGARARMHRGKRRWANQHVMSQAVEFFLLAGKDEDLPDGLLPEGFTATCTIEPVDDLPDEMDESITGWTDWRLAEYRVAVYNSFGDKVDEWTVEKIVREDDSY